jgi:hypothetical protein
LAHTQDWEKRRYTHMENNMTEELLKELNATSVKETPKELNGFVKKIEQKKAGEVYGDGDWDMNQPVFVVTVTNDDHNITARTTLPYFPPEKLTDNTKTGKWRKKYGQIDIGAQVTLIKNGNFFEVDLL